MKRMAILMVALAMAAACDDDSTTPNGPSNTGPIVFTSSLSAANEVPPVTNTESGGRGNVTITFNVPRDSTGAVTGGGNVTFAVQLSGFPSGTPIIAAHIHPGAAGANGSALVTTGLTAGAPFLLNDGTGNLSLTATILQADAQAIMTSPANYYFNVHTPTNGAGAARGQLTRTQ
jgi:hypothetical protein